MTARAVFALHSCDPSFATFSLGCAAEEVVVVVEAAPALLSSAVARGICKIIPSNPQQNKSLNMDSPIYVFHGRVLSMSLNSPVRRLSKDLVDRAVRERNDEEISVRSSVNVGADAEASPK